MAGPADHHGAGSSGFVNGDSAKSLTTQAACSTAATSHSTVAGSPYGSSCSGAADSNYTIGYASGSVTVGPAPLTVTASSGSFTYGGTAPAITAGYSGLVNGDSASSLTAKPKCSTTATSQSTVSGSPYTSSCSGAADSNYTIGYAAGSVTVKPAALAITASSGSITYGGTPPAISVAGYAGFVNGDSASSLTTQATCSTVATSHELGRRVSLQFLLLGGGRRQLHDQLSDGLGDGETGCPHHHGLHATSHIRGAAHVGAGYSGFEDGDSASNLTTEPTARRRTTARAPSRLALCVLVLGRRDSNYTISYAAGSVTVDPAAAHRDRLEPHVHLRGDPADVTPAYSGFVNRTRPPASRPRRRARRPRQPRARPVLIPLPARGLPTATTRSATSRAPSRSAKPRRR